MHEVSNATEKEHYIEAIEEMASQKTPEWLATLREDAAKRFAERPLPHRKLEAWRFTNVNPIIRNPFQPIAESGVDQLASSDVHPLLYANDWIELVFVDGWYAPKLSRNAGPGGAAKTAGLHEAIAAEDDLVEAHLGHVLGDGGNVFSDLNTALAHDGALVHIPKNVELDRPIHLVFVSSKTATESVIHPRVLVIADANSEATIIESHVSLAGEPRYFSNPVTEIRLNDGARLTRIKVLDEGPQGYHLSTTQVRQDRDSRFDGFTFSMGGPIGRNELNIVFEGEGAECSLRGLTLTEGSRLVDNAISVEHHAAHCNSWIGYKSVLEDKSHSVFCGRVYVAPGAQLTDSNQLNQNLLLSDKATVNTKPQLEIYADDVKCTHGATVGPPPQELVFYFQTRGMSQAMARGILTYGFADEVVNETPLDPVRDRLDRRVFDKYSPK